LLTLLLLTGCTKEFDYGSFQNAVETISYSNLGQISVEVSGNVKTDNGSSIISRGICYGLNSNPEYGGLTKPYSTIGLGNYTCKLDNLNPGITYYARAYATNSYGTAYGKVINFTTLQATVPIISSTTIATSITATTVYTGGNISNSGASSVTSRGVCYSSTTPTPTISGTKTIDGNGIGAFVSYLNGLSPNTTYYIRAYATNGIGTAYGDIKSFRTSSTSIPSVISTTIATNITQYSALTGGNIGNDGGATVTSRGVCWSSTTTNPMITNSNMSGSGSGTGSFSINLSSLLPGTTYYVRAFATNAIGTAYGNVVSFRTNAATIPVGLSTSNVSSINQNSSVSGGTIVGDGGSPIISRGVCWSNTTSSPTISNSFSNDGAGIGTFSSSLSGLTANTTYYVRAYATNSIGTAYGNTLTFTTLPNFTVGQLYQGGVIAYIFVPGDIGYIAGQTHGLIATTSNQSTSAIWGCSGTLVSGTGSTLGTGLNNSSIIVNTCTSSTIAAAICNNLTFGGYSDWYLPSRDELAKLYINRTSIGGSSNASYWSSSQSGSTTAWSINFITGTSSSITSKSSLLYVRAIRNF